MRPNPSRPSRWNAHVVPAFIRRQSLVALCFAVLAALTALAGIRSAAAQAPGLPSIPGHVEGVGSHFAVTDSRGLNITVDTSERVALTLDSLPRMIFFHIVPVSDATTTQLTITGLAANTTYYRYENGGPDPVVFATDASGAYGYVQDIAARHLVRIQQAPSTWHLRDDATGGDCTAIGAWEPSTKTCTLTQDVAEMIQIMSSGLTLDGAGHMITGGDSFGFGVFLSNVNDVTVKNAVVHDSATGIFSDFSSNSRFVGNSLVRNTYGIYLNGSGNNTLANNQVSDNGVIGIFMISQNGDVVTGNTVVNNGTYGIYLGASSDNAVVGNTVSNHYGGIFVWVLSNGNQVYNNNLLGNLVYQIFNYAFGAGDPPNTGNVFSKAEPIGGNHYDSYDTPAEGCNNTDQDLFCDGPYLFPLGQDDLPWAFQDGWRAPEFVRYCAFGWKDGGALEIQDGGRVDCSIAAVGKIELKQDVRAGGDAVSYGNKVELGDRATLGGDILAAKKVEIQTAAVVSQNVTSGDEIVLKTNARVFGDVTAAQKVSLDKGATVGGAITEDAAYSPTQPPAAVQLSLSAGPNDVKLGKNASLALPPGSYKKLDMDDRSTLSLIAGVYAFEEIKIGKDSVINIDLNGGALQVDVVKKLEAKERVRMILVGNSAPQRILFRIAGTDAKFGKQGSYAGTFVAPAAKIELDDEAVLTGALYGDKVEIKKRAALSYAPAIDLIIHLFAEDATAEFALSSDAGAHAAPAVQPPLASRLWVPAIWQ